MDDLLQWWKEVYLKFDPYEAVPCGDDDNLRFEEGENGMWTMKEATEDERARYKEVSRLEREMEAQLIEKMKQLCEMRMWLWS